MTTLTAREGYRIWAANYNAAPNPIVSLLDRNLDLGDIRGKRVMDVACGTGRSIERTGGIGSDLSFEMLARCTRPSVQADARQLPFPDGIADVVLCTLALGYIDPPRAAMEEMRRIAKPGGLVIVADLHPKAIAAGWKRSFRDADSVYEIANQPYSLGDLAIDGLSLEDSRDLYFGEPERAIFEQAGKTDRWEQACAIPALWMRRWRK
ncbi:MAG: class I SAM-dependent methyltransferase [Bryobacteraceae bacterium]